MNIHETIAVRLRQTAAPYKAWYWCTAPYMVLESCTAPYMSRIMTNPTKWHMRPAKTQISLGIRPDWSESSLSPWRKHRSLATHWAHSEDSDQTGRMPRLIWDFAGRTSFCWFCHDAAHMMLIFNKYSLFNSIKIDKKNYSSFAFIFDRDIS